MNHKNSKNKLNLLAFKILFLLGLTFFTFGLYNYTYIYKVLAFKELPANEVTEVSKRYAPVRISIDSTKIDLDTIEGSIVSGVWEVSEYSATYLKTGAFPGENGNIVIYGHNKKSVFGNLKTVKSGDSIKLTDSGGKEHLYTVSEVIRVKPENIEVVTPTDYEVLTVYTCIGLLDSERLVVKALPIN